MFLFYEGALLNEGDEYLISSIGVGQYSISIDTAKIGLPDIKTIAIVANWSAGAPYYSEALQNVTIIVTNRQTRIEITVPPSDTQYLDNVTFDFTFIDVESGLPIAVMPNDVRIISEGIQLTTGDYGITSIGTGSRISLNSTVISPSLISGWNITLVVLWTGGAPYYENDRFTVYVTTISRTGRVELDQVNDTPLGSNITLGLVFSDQAKGVGIEGASVVLSCLENPGLVENMDYWITEGTGLEAGRYLVEVNSSSLGSLGLYHFTLEVRWNPSVSPFFRNVTNIQMEGYVRAIQVSLSSELPTPSVAAFYQNISFTVSFIDIDNSLGILNAEGAISLTYLSTGLEPSNWRVQAIGGGVYNITLNVTDSLSTGLQYITINITLFPYQSATTQTVLVVRNRVGGLSADIPTANYAGEPTYVTVYLADEDSGGTPQSGATLLLTWGAFSSFTDLGDGRYNVTLFTTNLGFGIQTLTIGASLSQYSISPLSIEIELLAVTSELIVTWSGPRPYSPLEIYWGEPLTIYAAFNDTLRNQLVTAATVTYSWASGSDSFGTTGMPGNYSVIIDTSLGRALDTIAVIIEGQAPNYLNATAQISFQLLSRPMDVIPEESRYFFSIDWGGQASVVVYLQDSESGGLVTDANITASWEFANLTLADVPGRPGYYSANLPTYNASFGTYEIQISAFKENFANASVTLSMSISKIHMVLWLDNTTAAYEYTPVYWSEIVRIGVYVLTPALNTTDPYSTGLTDCIVRWFSPELGTNGTLLNGILIGGPGYYYFDFNTTESSASVHTFVLAAEPPNTDYTDAENYTTILVGNLPAIVQSPGSQDLVWGWNGYINFTFYDTFNEAGIHADKATYQWAGGVGDAMYLGNGSYGVPVDASTLRPGMYRLTISFQKINFNDLQLTIAVNIAPVPTAITLNLPDEYRVGETWTQLQVPYGDILDVVLRFNNTWNGRGISGAAFTSSVFSGPGFFEDSLTLSDSGSGSYSFVFDTTPWDLYSEFTFKIQFSLENHTTSVFTFVITIIEIPTEIQILGPSILSLSYSNETTFWVLYSDVWPGHQGQGISGASVAIENDNSELVTVELVGEDTSTPGRYQFRVVVSRDTGSANVILLFNKSFYVSGQVSLRISISPSEADIAMQNAVTFGSAFMIIIILSATIWIRVIKVPKIIRTLSSQIRSLRRKRLPKAAEVRSRQELVAQIFDELCEDLEIVKEASSMPPESIVVDVPEIGQLILDLAILTDMSTEEVDEFRRDISKMKMSQQTSFVAEVIMQEVGRVARRDGKTIEQVLEDVRLERQARVGGEAAPITLPGFDIEEQEAALFSPTEVSEAAEDRLNEREIQEMRTGLLERGLPMHEVDSVVEQARSLPKDVAEMLLKSFGQAVDMHEPDLDTAKLSDMEIEMIRQQLTEEGAGFKEINMILEQARDVPRALAMELLKGFRHDRETKKEKVKEPTETMSEEDLTALRGRLFIKGTPEHEIDAIIEQARTVRKELAAEFIKEVEERAPLPDEGEIEFADRLSEMEIEDLREELERRNLPKEEIKAILNQAKNLPSALIKDLLDSIDAEKK
ncbi:MAG: hypothetical protein ACFFD6_01240 [Candidatus Thorarchaeota archaeon]